MTPREVLTKTLTTPLFLEPWQDRAAAQTEAILAALKAEGLFIGPVVATAEMCFAAKLEPRYARNAWEDMVAEWMRGEGA